jgi:hypothetical protein
MSAGVPPPAHSAGPTAIAFGMTGGGRDDAIRLFRKTRYEVLNTAFGGTQKDSNQRLM